MHCVPASFVVVSGEYQDWECGLLCEFEVVDRVTAGGGLMMRGELE